jgi:hypothetical protein
MDLFRTDDLRETHLRFLLILVSAFLVLTYAHGLSKMLLVDRNFADFAHYYSFSRELNGGADIYRFSEADLARVRQAQDIPVHVAGKPEYSPLFFLVMTPFTLLPFDAANIAWMALNQAALLGCVWLAFQLAKGTGSSRLAALAAVTVTVFASQPLLENMGIGQVNVPILLALLYAALYGDRSRGHAAAAGVLLGFILLMKPQFGLFLLLFLMTGRYRAALSTVLSYALFRLLGVLFYGPQIELSYWANTIQNLAAGAGTVPVSYLFNLSLRGLFFRALPAGGFLPAALYGTAALAIFAVTFRSLSRADGTRLPEQYACMTCCMLLISPLTEEHHLVLAVLPFLVALFHLQLDTTGLLILLASFMLIQLRYSFTSMSLFDTGALSLFHGGKTAGVLILWFLFIRQFTAAARLLPDTRRREAKDA